MAYVAHEHDTNAGTNAILGVLLVVVALILGFIIFRNGLGAAPEAPGGSINIQAPSIPQDGAVGGGVGGDTDELGPQQQ